VKFAEYFPSMLVLIVLCIFLGWLVCAAVCIGIGGLLLRCFRFAFSPLDALWTGIALICAILQLYHFFRPVDFAAVLLLFALALAGWIWNRVSLFRRLIISTSQRLNALLFLIAATIIAFRAAGPCEHYDTGLYGATAIRWFISYPLVPGLGNLAGQLGFNSSVFLWMAALDQGPWHGLAHHLFVPFLIAALFASILPAAVRVFRGSAVPALDWFKTLLFIPAAIWAATGKIVGANTDMSGSVVCLAAAIMAFRGLDALPSDDETRPMSLVVAMMLFSLAVTFKISSVVFAFLGWTVALVKLWSLSRSTPQRKWLVYGAVLLSAAIVLPWIGRGLILTGYPLFPSTALSIPVDWRESAADAQWQADFARSFARVPELTMAYAHGWHWLGPWFRYMVLEREGFVIPLCLALVGAVVGLFTRSRRSEEPVPRWLWLLLPGLAGMLFWFLEAPAIRFGEFALWTTAATLGALAAIRVLETPLRKRVTLAALLLVTGWAAHPRLLWGSNFRPSIGVRSFLRLPEARVLPHRTSSGLVVYVPVETNQCWDAPLPCAPEFNGAIRLRHPGNLKRGFAPVGAKSDVMVPDPLP
jgi:hypothetical protein